MAKGGCAILVVFWVLACSSGGSSGGSESDAGATGGSGGSGGGSGGVTGGTGGGAVGGSAGAATGGAGGAAGGAGTGGSVTGGSGGGGPVPAGTVKGMISRTSSVSMPQDGKGTIYVDVGPKCPYTEGFASAETATIPNVDMNDPSVKIPWQITGIAPGTYAVWGWLDDNGDTMPATPFPSGDPANSTCVTVTLTASAGATADMVFNTVF